MLEAFSLHIKTTTARVTDNMDRPSRHLNFYKLSLFLFVQSAACGTTTHIFLDNQSSGKATISGHYFFSC